ncbi:YsnF/AvaK domain-containing protein [Nonomuraea salmonea]|uniref:YsnF/AvaK domain-containing protein n=1 Tax=Nonomuraea salmonea TaxID=46181 RepID=UPI002FEB2B1A
MDGRLSLDEETDLYRYYGMQPTDVPRQRPADFDDSGERQGFAAENREGLAAGSPGLMDRPGTGTGTGTGAGLGAGSGMSDMDRSGGLDESDRLIGDTPGTTDEPGLMPGGRTMGMRDDQPRGFTDEPRGFAGETGGFAEDRDIDMTCSEEQLHIGKESRESGRVRLHKYVETENVQESVPLSHEEVVIEREDIRDAGLSGSYEIGAEDREMILHEERPVIGKETVPVERIHVHKQDVQGEEIVEGQIRRERLEIDEEGPARDDGGYGRGDGFPPRR